MCARVIFQLPSPQQLAGQADAFYADCEMDPAPSEEQSKSKVWSSKAKAFVPTDQENQLNSDEEPVEFDESAMISAVAKGQV